MTSINAVKPNYYCKGQDYSEDKNDITGKIIIEKKALKKINAKLHITNQNQKSSSKLINEKSDIFTDKSKKFLNSLRKRFDEKKLIKLFESFNKKKILILGETIIDEYVFCEALGKSGKDPILVMREIKVEQFLGGVSSIAKCLSSYSNNITLVSTIGEKKEYLNFIKKNLPKKVKHFFLNKKNSPTILKKRYVDYLNKNKVFGSYILNDEFIDKENERKIISFLEKKLNLFDLVVTLDYGHGMISPKIAKMISKKSKYLCLNAQVNASNISYHSLGHYNKSNCIVINETELRRELRSREGSIKELMKKLSTKLNSKIVVVTRGSSGSILYSVKTNSFIECPAFAKEIVDKTGSGDNYLSTLALSLSSKIDLELSMLIGSLSAAFNVENYANEKFLDKSKMLKSLIHILK